MALAQDEKAPVRRKSALSASKPKAEEASPPVSPYMTSVEVSQRLNRSRAWVKSNAIKIGASMVEGAYRFPREAVEQFASGSSPVQFRPLTPKQGKDEGERAADIFERLESGQPLSQIVRELREPPKFVMDVREQWRACYDADRKGISVRCECGAPSNPQTAHCDRCAPRTRTLTPAQIRAPGGRGAASAGLLRVLGLRDPAPDGKRRTVVLRVPEERGRDRGDEWSS